MEIQPAHKLKKKKKSKTAWDGKKPGEQNRTQNHIKDFVVTLEKAINEEFISNVKIWELQNIYESQLTCKTSQVFNFLGLSVH